MTFDLVDPALVAVDEETRVARAVADIVAERQEWCGGFLCHDEVGDWSDTALGCALRGEHVTGRDVARLVDWYAERGLATQVQACAYSHPSLVRRLGEAGFVLKEMELVLAAHPAAAARTPWQGPDDLRIERVDPGDADLIARFADVTTRGFLDGRENPAQAALTERAARHERAISLVARLGGEIVGGASLEIWGDLAALYFGAVLPEARRRGIQLALMRERLEIAAAAGCRIATVGTLPGVATERNARRCGMAPCYTRVVLRKPIEGTERDG